MRISRAEIIGLIVIAAIGIGLLYDNVLSPQARAQAACGDIWSRASNDGSTMQVAGLAPPRPGPFAVWLTAAQDLESTIRQHDDCFNGDKAKYAGYLTADPIDLNALDQEIACVNAGGDDHCQVRPISDARLLLPLVFTIPTSPTPLATLPPIVPIPTAVPNPPRPIATAPPTVPSLPPPAGPTALCRDGTYSYSQHHQGTCSHHGGVAAWYR